MTTATTNPPDATRASNPFIRLYRGETSFDFIGRRRWWYILSTVIIVAGLVSLTTRGFNLGIDFKGGTSWEVTAPNLPVSTVTKAVEAAGVNQPVVEALGTGANTEIQVQADLSKLPTAKQQSITTDVTNILASLAHTSSGNVAL